MDQVNGVRPIIERLLGDHLEFIADDPRVETICVVDQKRDNYLLIEMGWEHPRRIYNVVFHVRIKDGKIWIEQDWTREGIGYQLIQAGVPAGMIEYGYQPPEMRPFVNTGMENN